MSLFKKIKSLFDLILLEEKLPEKSQKKPKKDWLDDLNQEVHKKRKNRSMLRDQYIEKIEKIKSEMGNLVLPLLKEMNQRLCDNEAEITETDQDIISPDDMSLEEFKDEIEFGGYIYGWDFAWYRDENDQKSFSVLIKVDEEYSPEIEIIADYETLAKISSPINVEELKEDFIKAFRIQDEKESEI